MTIRAFVVAVVLIAAAPAAHSSSVVTFENAAELNQFSRNGSASTTFVFSSMAGVGGGGGLKSLSNEPAVDSAIYSIGSANTLGGSVYVSAASVVPEPSAA